MYTFKKIDPALKLNLQNIFKSCLIHLRKLSTPTEFDSDHQHKKKEIETRQRQIMAKGLPKQKPIEGVKQILIVASGKGGVGKSTTAVNLSVALKIIEPTKSIGLLDADVFGPSIPLMMNIHESPLVNKHNFIIPPVNYGVKCMSMGFLIDEKSPVIWRGLMVMSALEKLLRQVDWGVLDYLIIDTPPGTGDTHLSLIQNLPISGALLVTSSQKAALDVTRRGASMFQKLGIPLVGVVENMSIITCPECHNSISLFNGDMEKVIKELDTQILQKIPLNNEITKSCDTGKPIVLSPMHEAYAKMYKTVAHEVIRFLNKQKIDENIQNV